MTELIPADFNADPAIAQDKKEGFSPEGVRDIQEATSAAIKRVQKEITEDSSIVDSNKHKANPLEYPQKQLEHYLSILEDGAYKTVQNSNGRNVLVVEHDEGLVPLEDHLPQEFRKLGVFKGFDHMLKNGDVDIAKGVLVEAIEIVKDQADAVVKARVFNQAGGGRQIIKAAADKPEIIDRIPDFKDSTTENDKNAESGLSAAERQQLEKELAEVKEQLDADLMKEVGEAKAELSIAKRAKQHVYNEIHAGRMSDTDANRLLRGYDDSNDSGIIGELNAANRKLEQFKKQKLPGSDETVLSTYDILIKRHREIIEKLG